MSKAKISAEELLDIPQIQVPSLKEIISLIEKCTYRVGAHEFLSDVFELSAIAVSNNFCLNKDREQNYKTIINRYDEQTQKIISEIFAKLFVLLSSQIYYGFNDYLGELYMKSSTSNSKTGQFFTPYNLSKLCAKTNIKKEMIEEYISHDKIVTMHEPTCGAGGMILAAADVLYNECHLNISRNFLVECGDIDKRCVHMTYLQLALSGIPAIIYHRDGLSLETWDRWVTPAYILQYSRFKNVFVRET